MDPKGADMEGNTKSAPRRSNLAKYWCFTGYDMDVSKVSKLLGDVGYYHMGLEKCPTTGREHLQGFIQARTKIRAPEKFKELKFHWELAKGSKKQNLKYTGKEGKVYTNIDFVPDPLEGKTLYGFQEDILKLIEEEPDDRTIHWFWEPKGCSGKTSLVKSICINRDDVIMVDGKAADAKFMIAGMKRKPKVVFMNLARTREDYVSYEAIESIKDGIFASTKYESAMVTMRNPHFIVFANFSPDVSKMSEDRWRIERIEEDYA